MGRQFWLSNDVGFRVRYRDDSRYGSAVSGRCDETLRELCVGVMRERSQVGLSSLVARAREILAATFAGPLAGLFDGPGTLSRHWLHPDPALTSPMSLQVERDAGVPVTQIGLESGLRGELASYLGEWEWGSDPPSAPDALRLWEALIDCHALVEVDGGTAGRPGPGATLVGHATIRLSDGRHTVLVDPFLLPKSALYPAGCQPLSLRDLGRPDAVLVTHGHPDHFDPGTLLRIGADTPIFVPMVAQESVLSVDMALRLRELGFRSVHPLRWQEEARVGAIRVRALPFFGEQPTVADVLHPEVRMQGNTYLADVGGRRVAMTVDSGTDHLGDVRDVARDAFRRDGPLDALFGGYRGFGVYPIQYLFSSVARYLTFVPEGSRHVRQKIMGDAHDLIDVAEIWGAVRVVPYADGGAPWHWMRGLGPALDRPGSEIPALDPLPESVLQAAASRSGTLREGAVASPVAVSLLRPGDSLEFQGHDVSIRRPGAWPYGPMA